MRPIPRIFAALCTVLFAACDAADSRPADTSGATASAAPSPSSAASTGTPADPRVATADTARIKGATDAPIWIVEISDFQCPFCRQWQEQTFPHIEREYLATGRAKLAYVHLPIPSIHRHAILAAEAAMCSGAQGRFWELHDAIFESQESWAALSTARPVFDSLAAGAGVSMDSWRQCMDSQVMRPLIERDSERSVASGATSTPTFLIMADSTIPDAQPAMLVGAQPIENFRRAIDPLLARRAGVRP